MLMLILINFIDMKFDIFTMIKIWIFVFCVYDTV
jgi:hypothetical protein